MGDHWRRAAFAVAGVLCAVSAVAPALAADAGGPVDAGPERQQPVDLLLDPVPGPIPPRRDLPLLADRAPAPTVELAIERCVESDMQAIGAPGAAVTVRLDGEELRIASWISRSGTGRPHPSNEARMIE